jgi:type II secretory pathway component GspD/PulD (secretin)
MNRSGVLHPVVSGTWRLLAGLSLVALTGAAAHAQNTVLEVIPLRYRMAQEVIPIIQPMLAREGSVSGFQGQLVVRTTPANLDEIKRILASIDTMPRQLLITVRQDTDVDRSRSAAEISGSVGGDNGRVTVPRSSDPRGGSVVLREGDDSVRLQLIEGSGSQSDRSTQSVRVMEGREAFVRVGQSMPVRERQVQRSVVGGRVVEQVVESTQYRDTATGFYILPRVSGDRVTLDISPQRETLSKQAQDGVNVQNMVTIISGRLGEWMEIGGIGVEASGQQSVLLGRTTAASRSSGRVLVKIEEVR